MEEWKSIKDYEDFYEISNFGNIRSLDRLVNGKNNSKVTKKGKLMTLLTGNDKHYLTIYLYKNGIKKLFSVHRLVAKTFIKNTNQKPFVNHKNGIKYDNHFKNLEWCTRKENVKHAVETGLIQKGENHGRALLTNLQVIEIKKLLKTNIKQVDIAKIYNVSKHVIGCIKRNKSWKNIN